MSEGNALAAEGLGRRYSRRRDWAVKDLNLEIPTGSVTALVGPNGAGKSTLIRCWIGFERPDAGRVLVHGVNPIDHRAAVIQFMGYVPQATALYRGLSVDDHFRFGSIYRQGFDRPKALDRMRSVGIDSSRRVGELSGGEQAQVTLAIALATRAPVLLLDEPLASLDPLARREFLTVLAEDVRATGATVVLSSHIITDVQQACDRIVVLSRGRIVLHEPINEMLIRYRTMAEADVGGRTAVATFSGPNGERLALVRGDEPDLRSASLEEIVLGHLAIGQAYRPVAGRDG